MADRYLETFFNTAQAKRFAFPGALLWGADTLAQVPAIVGELSPVDLYVDSYFTEHPLIQTLKKQLGDRVRSNQTITEEPRTQAVKAEAALYLTPPGAVVAVGGGSTLDFAKAITAQRLFGDMDGVGMGQKRGLPPLAGSHRPLLVAVPTTAGTGADVSRYYVTYDSETKHKVHGKSWELIADWSVLDPAVLRDCPQTLLATTAFDTFVHLLESLICRYESSWYGQMLANDCIPRVMGSLEAIIRRDDRSDDPLLQLLYSASVAGMAISNVRTGNIHEAAGALLEVTDLSHSETLFVFFRQAYDQYKIQTANLTDRLVQHLHLAAPELDIDSMEAVCDWWTSLFDDLGISARIRHQLTLLGPRATEVQDKVFDRVWSDRVWLEKESPVALDVEAVRSFIADSLASHGLMPDG